MGILYCLWLGVRIFLTLSLTPMDLIQKKKRYGEKELC